MLLATDRDDYLIQMPLIVWSWAVSADAMSEVLTKAVDPQSDGLAADNDSSLRQKILNIRHTQGEAVIRPDGVGDNLTRVTKAFQARQVSWSIHKLHLRAIAHSNNLAIPRQRQQAVAELEIDDSYAFPIGSLTVAFGMSQRTADSNGPISL